jgi:threonine dehydratase
MGKNIFPGYAGLEISVETKNNEHIDMLYKVLKESNASVEVAYF